MIYGICGFRGSGKDTVANIFTEYGYDKKSLASSVKDVCSSMFLWDRSMLEGDTVESRTKRMEVDEYWTKCLAGKGIFKDDKVITPVIALQRVGTDLIRKMVDDKFWIHRLQLEILKSNNKNIVISDIRFPNESNICDRVINVKRFDYTNEELNKMHISETEHLKIKPYMVIENDGSIDDLENYICDILDLK